MVGLWPFFPNQSTWTVYDMVYHVINSRKNSVLARWSVGLYFSKHWERLCCFCCKHFGSPGQKIDVRTQWMEKYIATAANFHILWAKSVAIACKLTRTVLDQSGNLWIEAEENLNERGKKKPVENCILWQSVCSPVAKSSKIWTSPR